MTNTFNVYKEVANGRPVHIATTKTYNDARELAEALALADFNENTIQYVATDNGKVVDRYKA